MIERLLAADAALEREELDAAERLFAQVAGADPRNAIAVVGMARIAMRRDDQEGARELARRALDIDPQEAAAGRLLAELDAPAGLPVPAHVLAAEPTPDPVSAPVERSWWRRFLDRMRGRS